MKNIQPIKKDARTSNKQYLYIEKPVTPSREKFLSPGISQISTTVYNGWLYNCQHSQEKTRNRMHDLFEIVERIYNFIIRELEKLGIDIRPYIQETDKVTRQVDLLWYMLSEIIKNSIDAYADAAYNGFDILPNITDPLQIKVVTARENYRIIITIKDNGPGIKGRKPGERFFLHEVEPTQKYVDPEETTPSYYFGGMRVGLLHICRYQENKLPNTLLFFKMRKVTPRAKALGFKTGGTSFCIDTNTIPREKQAQLAIEWKNFSVEINALIIKIREEIKKLNAWYRIGGGKQAKKIDEALEASLVYFWNLSIREFPPSTREEFLKYKGNIKESKSLEEVISLFKLSNIR